jgi:hypothetical protein
MRMRMSKGNWRYKYMNVNVLAVKKSVSETSITIRRGESALRILRVPHEERQRQLSQEGWALRVAF